MDDFPSGEVGALPPETDPVWDDWDTPPRLPGIPVLHLTGFDGPMDLLLDLAERQRIDLGHISVLQLTEQFLAAMARLAPHVALERRADWFVLASRLVLLRSLLLFSAAPEQTQAAEREAERTAAQLQQLVFLRRAASWLADRPQLGRDVFARPSGRSARLVSYMALLEACLAVLRGSEGQNGTEDQVYRLASAPAFHLDAAVARIRALLQEGGMIEFARCLPRLRREQGGNGLIARAAVASSFAAVLEIMRQGEAGVTQHTTLAPIVLVASVVGRSPREHDQTARRP